MNLYPSISSELELAGKLIIPLLVFLLIAFVAKKVENKSISFLLENLLALGIMVYNIAVGIFFIPVCATNNSLLGVRSYRMVSCTSIFCVFPFSF